MSVKTMPNIRNCICSHALNWIISWKVISVKIQLLYWEKGSHQVELIAMFHILIFSTTISFIVTQDAFFYYISSTWLFLHHLVAYSFCMVVILEIFIFSNHKLKKSSKKIKFIQQNIIKEHRNCVRKLRVKKLKKKTILWKIDDLLHSSHNACECFGVYIKSRTVKKHDFYIMWLLALLAIRKKFFVTEQTRNQSHIY